MSDEPNKGEKQDQPGASTAPAEAPSVPEMHAQAGQAADGDHGVAPLSIAAIGKEDKEPQQGTKREEAHGEDGVHQTGPEPGGCDRPQSAPVTQAGRHCLSPQAGEANEQSAQVEDLFTVTDESEEEKRTIVRVMASHHSYLGYEDIAGDPEESPEVAGPEQGTSIWPEYEEFEPPPMLDLIRREGHIEVARIEWRGLRPTLTVVSDRYRIPSMPSAVYRSLPLPNDVAEYQSARQVFDAVYDALQNCSALSRQQCEVLTCWCIASWFQDSLDFLPHITISGPQHMAQLLFSVLEYVCHKPIKLIDMNLLALRGISLEQLKPTLLIRQVKATKSATHLLHATDYPGYLVPTRDGLQTVHCAKVVYIGEAFPKQTTSQLHIHLGRNVPVPARPYRSVAAVEQLQSKLLSYRAFNCGRADFLEVAPGELQPEFDVIARRLGAVIVNDSVLQRRLVELLKGWSEDVRAERAGGIDATVLTAALNLAHSSEPQAYVREVAAGANRIRVEMGETQKLSNEKVGHVLRKLGLHTHRDMNGRRLLFDQDTQLLVHDLCFEYDVLPAAPECGYCHKLQTPESE